MAAGDASIMQFQVLKDENQKIDQDPDQDLEEETIVLEMTNPDGDFLSIIPPVTER